MNEHLACWLKTAKHIATICAERDNALGRNCPVIRERTEPDRDSLKDIARMTEDIEVQARKLIKIERDAGIGCTALLRREPTPLEVTVLSLLLCCRLDSEASSTVSTIAEVCSMAGARTAAAATVRAMFRGDGSLHGHVVLDPDVTLDGFRVRLSERAYCAMVGLSASDPTVAMCEAVALTGRRR